MTWAKNSDHTISYISHYLTTIPLWIKRIHLFLDNAGSTNKNMYVMAWAMEMVQHHKFDVAWISFMITGHTKFSVDQLFSRIAQSYNRSDVFTIAELGNVAEPYCSVKIDTGGIVKQWRSFLTKYTNIPGIQSFHNFVFARNPLTGDAECRVRVCCHEGTLNKSPLKIVSGHSALEVAIPQAALSYLSSGLIKEITPTKRANLVQMYKKFIFDDRLLEILS